MAPATLRSGEGQPSTVHGKLVWFLFSEVEHPQKKQRVVELHRCIAVYVGHGIADGKRVPEDEKLDDRHRIGEVDLQVAVGIAPADVPCVPEAEG